MSFFSIKSSINKIGKWEQFQNVRTKIISHSRIRQIFKCNWFGAINPLCASTCSKSTNQYLKLFIFFFRLHIEHIHEHTYNIRTILVQNQSRSFHIGIKYAPARVCAVGNEAAEVALSEFLITWLYHHGAIKYGSEFTFVGQHFLHTVEERADKITTPCREIRRSVFTTFAKRRIHHNAIKSFLT